MMCVKKMKNEKRKSTIMPLSKESKTSEVTLGQFHTLAFPHIYPIIHNNRGNPISSAIAIRFHLYLCYPMFFTLPRQGTIHWVGNSVLYSGLCTGCDLLWVSARVFVKHTVGFCVVSCSAVGSAVVYCELQ